MQPTSVPTSQPSGQPSSQPTCPTGQPSSQPTNPTGQPSGVPSMQPTSRPSTEVRTRITFSLKQVIKGISNTDFSNGGQMAFKRAIVATVPGLQVKDITIDSITNYARRLRTIDENDVAITTGNGRKLGVTDATEVEYTISTVSEAVDSTQAPADVASEIQATIDTASNDGSLVTNLETAADGEGTGDLFETIIVTSSSTGSTALTITADASSVPTGQPSGSPSSQPTTQPSSQPSMQPTGMPSGQPSSAPTNAPVDYFLVIDLDFFLATELPIGGTIIINLPQLTHSKS
jgi:hypothetical protein